MTAATRRNSPPAVLPDWSPDAKRLAVLHEGAVWVVTRDGSSAPMQVTPASIAVEQLHWSPDGTRLAIAGAPAAPTLGGAAVIIAAGGHPGANRSIQLVTLMARRHGRSRPTASRSVCPTRASRTCANSTGSTTPLWSSPDARAGEGRLGETSLVVLDTLGAQLRTLPLGEGVWHAPVVSPDRKQIAFTGTHGAKRAGRPKNSG